MNHLVRGCLPRNLHFPTDRSPCVPITHCDVPRCRWKPQSGTNSQSALNLSTLTSVTTVPYVRVPAVAAVLLSTDTEAGLVHLFTIAAVSVGLGALIFAAFLAVLRLPTGELLRTLR